MLDLPPPHAGSGTGQTPLNHRTETRWNEGIRELVSPNVDGSTISLTPLIDGRGQIAFRQSNSLENTTIPLPPNESEQSIHSSDPIRTSAEINTPSLDSNPLLEHPGSTEPSRLNDATYATSYTPSPHPAVSAGKVEFRTPHIHSRASDNNTETSSLLSPSERTSPRVRWNPPNPRLPRWDTPHPYLQPNPPPPQSIPAPQSIPPIQSIPLPTVNPTYSQHGTPLWSSNPPTLRSFPNPPLSHTSQTPPWQYTPHPLPLNPATPLYSVPLMTPQSLNGYVYGYTPETPHMMNRPLNVADNSTYEHRQQPHIGGEQGPPTAVMRTISDRPHERFFLMDGSIEFRVHDVLFRVHLHFFSRAKVFRIFGLYLPPVIDLNGYGLNPSEFELLLTVFYPRTFGTFEIQNVEGWASVLKVASALGMDDIRTLAIEKLLEISSPVDLIMLAKSFSFIDPQMLVLAFKELCMRPEPLTEEEGKKLGAEFLNKLARMKHELQHNTAQYLDSDKVDRMLCRLVET